MRIVLTCLILICFSNCKSKTPSFIQGYIYSSDQKPVTGLKVVDPYDSKTYDITEKNGYFRINHMTKGEFLYVKFNEEKIDSIYFIRTHPERGEKYYFTEGRSDTLFVNAEKMK